MRRRKILSLFQFLSLNFIFLRIAFDSVSSRKRPVFTSFANSPKREKDHHNTWQNSSIPISSFRLTWRDLCWKCPSVFEIIPSSIQIVVDFEIFSRFSSFIFILSLSLEAFRSTLKGVILLSHVKRYCLLWEFFFSFINK